MQQPKGFNDGASQVCLLIKSIYSLHQARRQWNIVFNTRTRKHGYTHLRSDPCIYVLHIGGELAIITVWVDDLLLFTTIIRLMECMKNDLHTEWEMTNLGKLAKIVGIEISCEQNSISISQKLYIKSILKCEGMERSNPVGMPLNPNYQ